MDVSWPITVLGTGNLDPKGVRFLLCTIKVYIGIITCILYFFFRNSKLLFKYEYESETMTMRLRVRQRLLIVQQYYKHTAKPEKCKVWESKVL